MRNQLTECRRLGVPIELRRGRVAGARGREATRRRHRGHRRRAGPPVVGARRRRAGARRAATSSMARQPPEDRRSATSWSSTRSASTTPPRWPSCWPTAAATVEVVTNGMVVGQDLGITLDMEGWWMRAEAKGIVQSTDLVPMGLEGRSLHLLHHPTGHDAGPVPGLGGAGRPRQAGRVAVPRAQAARRRSSSGSATAWPPAGPTPRSSTASGSGRRCDRAWCPCGTATGGGGAEVVAECGGRAVLVGSGVAAVGGRTARGGDRGPAVGGRAVPSGAWAATLAPLLERRGGRGAAGLARRPRPGAAARARPRTGRCWPARSPSRGPAPTLAR